MTLNVRIVEISGQM